MKKKYTIGVMAGNANSPYTVETLNGIYEAAAQADANVICFTGVHSSFFYKDYFEKENQEDYSYQSCIAFDYDNLCDVDAMIVYLGTMSVFMTERELHEFQRRLSVVPNVYLQDHAEGPNICSITENNYKGIKNLMDHLINFHGYEKILYLSGPKGHSDADERLDAYRDAMNEAGLHLDDSMIQFGDFSDAVNIQVNALLDAHPDADALVCANDLMATAAYRVLETRAVLYEKAMRHGDREGIERYKKHIVGENSEFGIAITGFDNISDALNLDPPLTTVEQSPFTHGVMAVKTAISLIENPEKTESIKATPTPIYRQSCGCRTRSNTEFPELNERYEVYPEQYAAIVAENFTSAIVSSSLNKTVTDEIYSEIYEIILKNVKNYLGVSSKPLNASDTIADIKRFLTGKHSKYISVGTFVKAFNDFMLGAIETARDPEKTKELVDIESKVSVYTYSSVFANTRNEVMMYRHRTWFMPLISRDMANDIGSYETMFKNAMAKIQVLEVGDAYLFLLDKPVRHRHGEKWQRPETVRLVASSQKGEIKAYGPENAPYISNEDIINNYIGGGDDTYSAALINLYSGEYQYGFLVAKSKPEDILTLYCITVQVSTAIKYCEMAEAQRKAQRQLEEMIKEVEEKNEILRSLSEYDQMTGCFNRRGFLESAQNLIKDNIGKDACLVFADLDHLKEINDKFGHSEGDFAIENAAKNMRAALPSSAIIARLGGDEFVAIFVVEDGMDVSLLVKNIANTAVAFNAISPKPYYVECSAGYKNFTCGDDVSLEDVMDMADGFLYEAKARRRTSIVKKITIL